MITTRVDQQIAAHNARLDELFAARYARLDHGLSRIELRIERAFKHQRRVILVALAAQVLLILGLYTR